jgi:hypothetical protein
MKKLIFGFTAFLALAPYLSFGNTCSLTTKQKIRERIYPALSQRYSIAVRDDTWLDIAATDLYPTVFYAVRNAGCELRNFGLTDVEDRRAGKIIQTILEDLMAP